MIVENNTGLTNATSYCDVNFANDYLKYESTFANWSPKTTQQKETALEYGTFALDEIIKWLGTKLNTAQSLELPTDKVLVDSAVKKAVSLIALDYVNGKYMLEVVESASGISSISVPDMSISLTSAVKSSGVPQRVLSLLTYKTQNTNGAGGSYKIERV